MFKQATIIIVFSFVNLISCNAQNKKTVTLNFEEDKIKILPYDKNHELEITLPYENQKYLIPENLDEAVKWLSKGLSKDYINQLLANNEEGLGWKKYAASSLFKIEDYIYSSWNLGDVFIKEKICQIENISLPYVEIDTPCDYIILECLKKKIIGKTCVK